MTTSPNKVTLLDLLKRPACLLAYGFGSGLSPKAPGTMGTIAALPIYWLIHDVGMLSYLLITFIAFFAGIWICQ
ncbi:MAG TPA: phosphatidylglycerophosphatase A, partial [Methylophaga sp.]|nr:phosphatidylglycerophosphatase A [Methylophaga sp.]HCD03700.1 phosphatidylglycerophosphatase A [Methylophaga sp.]